MNIKNYISGFLVGAKKGLVKRSPELMLGLGIGTAFAAVITAATATPKALKAIEEKKHDLKTDANLSTTETVKTVWKYYIPSAVLFASSVVLLVSGHHIASKRTAAIAAAASVTETALRQYKDAIAENVAPEIKEKIEDAVSTKQMQRAPDPRDAQTIILNQDGTLFYEPITGSLFKSDRESIRAAANDLKHDMLCDGYGGTASLGDLFDKLNVNLQADAASSLGWNISSNCLDDISFSAQIAQNGEPCLVLRYDKPPIWNFEKSY